MLYILSIYVRMYYINRKNFKFLTFFTKVLTARERVTNEIYKMENILVVPFCKLLWTLVMFSDEMYTRFILFQYPYTYSMMISIIFHIVTDFSWNSQLCKRIWFIILSWNSPLCNKSLEQRYHPKLSEP